MRDLVATLLILASFVVIGQAFHISTLNDEVAFQKKMADSYKKESQENADYAQVQVEAKNQCEYDKDEAIHTYEERNGALFTRYVEIVKRISDTTNILESVARCGSFKLTPDHCGVDADYLKKYMEDNRKANF